MLSTAKGKIDEAYPDIANKLPGGWDYNVFFKWHLEHYERVPAPTTPQTPPGSLSNDSNSQQGEQNYRGDNDNESNDQEEPEIIELSSDQEAEDNACDEAGLNTFEEPIPADQLQVLPPTLLLPECTRLQCIHAHNYRSGFCNDAIHYPPLFKVSQRTSLRDRFDLGTPSRRSTSPSVPRSHPKQLGTLAYAKTPSFTSSPSYSRFPGPSTSGNHQHFSYTPTRYFHT